MACHCIQTIEAPTKPLTLDKPYTNLITILVASNNLMHPLSTVRSTLSRLESGALREAIHFLAKPKCQYALEAWALGQNSASRAVLGSNARACTSNVLNGRCQLES